MFLHVLWLPRENEQQRSLTTVDYEIEQTDIVEAGNHDPSFVLS